MVVSSYVVELTPPDLRPYQQGNIGIEYVYQFPSGHPGPHVLISAIVHGNEICGAIAVDHLLQRLISQQIQPWRGILTLAFMNVAAFERFDPEQPQESRFVDEDFNRLWTPGVLGSARDSVELRRARQIRPLLDQVDYLLDIHSMLNSPTPLMMAGPLAKGRELAQGTQIPEIVVTDAGHLSGKRMRDYGAFVDPASSKNALLIECGQHWLRSSATLAIEVVYRFLSHLQILPMDLAAPDLSPQDPPAQRFIEVTGPVTVQTDRFQFTQPFVGLEVIPQAGTIIGYDGDRPVKTPYDNCVLVMPTQRLKAGHTAVRLGRFL